MMGTGINDAIIEPVRSSLIPNFYQVKEAVSGLICGSLYVFFYIIIFATHKTNG